MKRAPLPLLAVVVVFSLLATAVISCIRATTASSSSSSSFARRPLLGHQYRGGGGGRGEDGDEVRMGTTILAVRYHGGIVAGADTRTSSNGYVTNRYATKLTFVLDPIVDDYITTTTTMMTSRTDDKEQTTKQRITVVSSTRSRQQQQQRINNPTATAATASTCVICRSGSAADTQTLTSIVQSELLSRQVLHNIHGTVTHAASLLHTLLLNDNDSSMSASLICTGYDHELHRGIIYTINKGGVLFEETYYSCLGSGSTYIIGHLDSYYNNCHHRHRQRLENNNNDTIIKDTTNTVYNDNACCWLLYCCIADNDCASHLRGEG